MSAWSNNDNYNSKPKSPYERQTREAFQFQISSGNTAGNSIITVLYNDGGQNNVANIGVAAGQYVYFLANTPSGNGISLNGSGQAGNGVPGMFESNTQIQYISGNTITLTNPLFGYANTGWIVEIDKAIVYGGPQSTKVIEINYNADTVLLTPTRMANAVFAGTANSSSYNLNSGMSHQGWNKVTTFTGGRAGRVQTETLVVLANPTASNTISGNTSNSLTYFSGV
jgi:hypothetical protein